MFKMSLQKSILYFNVLGELNTDETLMAAKERAKQLGINDVVVASTGGATGLKAVVLFKGYNVVVVRHVTGYKEPGVQKMSEEYSNKIYANGGKIVTSEHTFTGGVNKAIENKFNTVYPAGIMAQTLRLFGEGTKVCLECVAMAADAGEIPIDKDVIAIAGTNVGADTAMVLKPAGSRRIFDMRVKEIITKPHNP